MCGVVWILVGCIDGIEMVFLNRGCVVGSGEGRGGVECQCECDVSEWQFGVYVLMLVEVVKQVSQRL